MYHLRRGIIINLILMWVQGLRACSSSRCSFAGTFVRRSMRNNNNSNPVNKQTKYTVMRALTSANSDGVNYFLLKSEPTDYSIQDLDDEQDQREEWDGVRNYQARNIMKSMKVGDRAFFYHSSCKVPGVVGSVTIAREAGPDLTALDPNHKNHDPKSTTIEDCRWVSVLVEFDQMYAEVLSLRQLKEHAKTDDIIEGMTLFRNTRLSVHALTAEQFHAVEELAAR